MRSILSLETSGPGTLAYREDVPLPNRRTTRRASGSMPPH